MQFDKYGTVQQRTAHFIEHAAQHNVTQRNKQHTPRHNTTTVTQQNARLPKGMTDMELGLGKYATHTIFSRQSKQGDGEDLGKLNRLQHSAVRRDSTT